MIIRSIVRWWVIYVVDVYVSSDPDMYIVYIRFALQNRVWHKWYKSLADCMIASLE